MMRLESGEMPYLVVLAPDVCQRSGRSVKWLRTSPPTGHQRADRYSGNPAGAAARPALNAWGRTSHGCTT